MTTRIAPEGLVELDRPLAEFFRTLSGPWPFRPLFALTPGKHLLPTADVFARNGDMVVKLDLPVVEPKDIHVKLEPGELIVTGERTADHEVKEGHSRKESSYGLFERHMSVPKGIKAQGLNLRRIDIPGPCRTATCGTHNRLVGGSTPRGTTNPEQSTETQP